MTESSVCDICGHTFQKFNQPQEFVPSIELDPDGLWICRKCKSNIDTNPIGIQENFELDDRLKRIIGKSAGTICRTLELPDVPPYEAILKAAANIAYDQDLMMSAWLFSTQWLDGTTVWRNSDGSKFAFVSENGEINFQDRD